MARRRGGRSGRVLRRGLLERVLRDLHVGSGLEEPEIILAEESLPRLDELVERPKSPERADQVHDLGPEGPMFPLTEAHLDGTDLPVAEVGELQALSLVLHDGTHDTIQFLFRHEKLPLQCGSARNREALRKSFSAKSAASIA